MQWTPALLSEALLRSSYMGLHTQMFVQTPDGFCPILQATSSFERETCITIKTDLI